VTVGAPVRVVHLGRSTCHAISGPLSNRKAQVSHEAVEASAARVSAALPRAALFPLVVDAPPSKVELFIDNLLA